MNEMQLFEYENTDVSTWDLSVLRARVQGYLSDFEGLVYTDETIKEAKNDKAQLNKVKKVIEDARKAYKAKCLAPYEELEPHLKELVDLVEQQRLHIDETVKDYEARQKEAKELEIRKYYDCKAVVLGDLADALYQKLFDKKWLNATTSKSKYEEGILTAVNGAKADLDEILAMHSPFEETLVDYYKTLPMDQVRSKREELESAARKASFTSPGGVSVSGTPEMSPVMEQVHVNTEEGTTVRIYANKTQMNQITDFMKAIGVRYELI